MQQDIAAYKSGNRKQAWALLLRCVEIDQHNELAWLLLNELAPDIDSEISALENLLFINPAHFEARDIICAYSHRAELSHRAS